MTERGRGGGLLTRLVQQSGVYTLGNLLLKGSGLLLLALYLDPELLAQAEFGRLALLDTTASILIAAVSLGLPTALLKFSTDAGLAAERERVPATALATAAALAAACVGLVYVLAGPLSAFLVDDAARTLPVRLLGLHVGLKVVGLVPLMVLRVEERAGLYVVAVVAEAALLVGGVWYALVARGAGLEGVLVAYVASAGVSAAVMGGAVLVRATGGVRPGLAARLLRFGAPLAAAGLAGIVLNTGDQLLIKAFRGAEANAVYALAAKFGGLINMLFVQSFSAAFGVLGLKAQAGAEGTGLHRRTFRHYAVLTGWGVLGVSLLALDVTEALSPNPAFRAAEPMILPIALGFLAYGLYTIALNVLYATERTKAVAGTVALAAGLNVALNCAAIPLFGALGAALTTLVAYGVLAAMALRQAEAARPTGYPWAALASVLLLVGGLWALAQPTALWDPLPRLAARLGLIALYPPAVLAAGLYSRAEAGRLWALARARLAGR